MSLESYIQAMPKVELHVHLDGAMQQHTLLVIAEQNEVAELHKDFDEWVDLLDNPDNDRLDEIVRMASAWLLQPDDLARVVYDLGVALSKQNVRYAEVSVNPSHYMQHGLSFEGFLDAINDGRDRAERGWKIQMAWVLTISRDEPRSSDEISRWATSAFARKGAVVALGLSGREDAQPLGQFERAFRTAEKKDIARVPHAGDILGAEGILEALDILDPDRIIDGWGAADAPDVLERLAGQEIPLDVSLGRAVAAGWVSSYSEYPLRRLYDEDVKLIIGSDMPSLFHTTLSDEYLAVVEHCGFEVSELEELALNAVRYSRLSAKEKATMLAEMAQTYETLRTEHITLETT